MSRGDCKWNVQYCCSLWSKLGADPPIKSLVIRWPHKSLSSEVPQVNIPYRTNANNKRACKDSEIDQWLDQWHCDCSRKAMSSKRTASENLVRLILSQGFLEEVYMALRRQHSKNHNVPAPERIHPQCDRTGNPGTFSHWIPQDLTARSSSLTVRPHSPRAFSPCEIPALSYAQAYCWCCCLLFL